MDQHPSWQRVELGGEMYLFQLVVREGMMGYTCYLTDLVNIYKEQIDKDGFSKKFSEVNGDIELDDIDEGFREVIKIMNKQDKKVNGKVLFEEDIFNMDVEWISDGIPYKWTFNLVRGSSTEFHDMITKSLLKGMAILLQEKKELVSIIRSKDLELEDYENSGAKLTRKALKTSWFKEDEAFNERKPVFIDNEIDFMSSSEVLSVIDKPVQKPTETQNCTNAKLASNLDISVPHLKESVKESTPNLDSKRKIAKPDLSKIADKMNNKKRKLNSL